MLDKILKFSLANRLLVVTAFALLSFVGTYVAFNMDVDVFPDLTAPTVVVLTEAHGLAPEEVERLVTFPIETAVNGATHVRRVRSASSAGFSVVWVEFEWDTDIYIARQIVNEKIAVIAERLPLGVGTPTMAPQSSIMGEIMFVALTADSTSMMELRTIADWIIRPRLLGTGGVAQVIVYGGEFKQYQILANPQKMMYHQVSLAELMDASAAANGNSSGGFMNEYGNEYIVKGMGRTSDLYELGRSIIKKNGEQVVRIEDVAEVRIGAAPKIGDASNNAKPAVVLSISKQPEINTLNLTKQIDRSLEELRKTLPQDIQIDTHAFRQADFIQASVSNIQKVLLEGSAFVVIVLFLFLMNWRATVISLLAIPISLIVAILTLKWLGFTINTMSLGGMAIAIGDLVDDAIIDVENVFKRLKENAKLSTDQRKNSLDVIFNASWEIRHSIINATFIIMVAFLPLFFLSGMEGKLLAPLGIAFIVSLFASLIIAITLTPVLCSFLLTNEKQLMKEQKESWLVEKLQHYYGLFLEKAMQFKKLFIGTTAAALLLALITFTQLGRSFLPEFNEGALTLAAVALPGLSLEESNQIGKRIEEALLSVPEVRSTTRRTGRAELDEHAQGVNSSEIEVPFELDERDRAAFLQDVRDKLSHIKEANISVGQPISHRIDHMLSGTRANLAIKIFGTDLNRMYNLGLQIRHEIEGIEGLIDLQVEPQIEIPQIQIRANRELLSEYGISVGHFNHMVDVGFGGEKVSEIYEGNRSFNLLVRFDEQNRGKMDHILNTLIDTGDGEKVPIHYVADVVSGTGPNTINRENVQRKMVVSANISGRDQKSVVNEVKQRISEKIKLPEGYHVELGGQFEAEEEASNTLMIASLFSILVIFLILFQEFKKIKLASVILLNLPLALIGGVFTIYFSSGILSIPGIIGFITLFGIATRNGILLVSHYESLKDEGLSLHSRIIQGSKDRLSPILMTAITAALALIPLAMAGDKPGNEIQSPMAQVILGGLSTSTLLNLIIVPMVYSLTQSKAQAK